jgi:metallo-beta-lactamase class B
MSTTQSRARIAFRHWVGLAAAAAVALSMAVAPPAAQQQPPNPTKEDLAKDNKLFMTLARKSLKWDLPTEPAKVVGPLHYVGTAGLASYLFATKEGHILFNTGMPDSGPMIVESIRKLGFDPKDIKILVRTCSKPLTASRSHRSSC